MKTKISSIFLMLVMFVNIHAQDGDANNKVSPERIIEFIHWYPAIEQAKMRDEWLSNQKKK